MIKRRKCWIGLVAVIVGAITAVGFWPAQKEPEYQGTKLSEWVAMTEESPHLPIVETAIITIGTNNIPLLLHWLDYKQSKIREWVDDHSDSMPDKLKFLVRNRADERADAAETVFRVLGMRATAAIPELLRQAPQHVEASDMRAFICLCYMGEASFPAVARMATNKQSAARGQAAWCVGSMENLGINTVPAVRLLCELIRDSDRQIAQEAVKGLGELRAEPEIALPALLDVMHRPDLDLRTRAIWSIGQFGTNARPVVPQLINALDHQNLALRGAATNVVNAIAPEFFKTNGIEMPPSIIYRRGCFEGIGQVLTNNQYMPREWH